MSLATICGVTVLRSLIISILGVFLSCHLSKLSDINNPKRSFRLFILVLAPLLVPDLIVGYTWSLISLKLVHYPFLLELVYSGLLLMKVVPVGIICFCFTAPPAISPEADFIRKSVGSSSAQITGVASRGSFFLWKNVMRAFPVGALLFLLSFQEFEMAALLGRATWTVSVFDAHAGGVPVIDSISFLQGPLLVELIVISGAVLLLQRTKNQPRIKQRSSETGESYRSQVLSWLYLLVAFLLIVLIPFSLTGWGCYFIEKFAGKSFTTDGNFARMWLGIALWCHCCHCGMGFSCFFLFTTKVSQMEGSRVHVLPAWIMWLSFSCTLSGYIVFNRIRAVAV